MRKREVTDRRFEAVLKQARKDNWLWDEQFAVGGTLLQASTSLESSQKADEAYPSGEPICLVLRCRSTLLGVREACLRCGRPANPSRCGCTHVVGMRRGQEGGPVACLSADPRAHPPDR